ncbi:MAG: two-component regulator propeller domain-containing protein, partial [Bacteroidota bacterium]|nr:two-component regulator propeller domain-containing protein [Bacteroidota bacterium]
MIKKLYLAIFLINILLLISDISNCQNPILKHYNVKDGLPSTETYHVFQDSKGYIWFATDMGVSRFDGYKFENFDVQDGLSENTVFEIFEDSKNRIWFITFSCKLSYFYKDSIYTYKYNEVIKNNFDRDILPKKKSFYIDSNDNVYFSIDNIGLLRINKNGIIKNLTGKYYQFDNFDNKIIASNINIPTSTKLLVNNTNTFLINPKDKLQNCKLFGELINSDELIINTKNKIIKIKNKKITKQISLNKSIIWLNKDNGNNILIGTRDGAYKYDNNLNNRKKFLKGKAITSILQDNEGSYWFSTHRNGIYYMSTDKILILNKKSGLINNKVLKIEKGKNNEIWLGYSIPYISNINGNNFTHYKTSEHTRSNITSLLYDNKNDKLWFANDENLLSIKNKKIKIHKNPDS